MATSNPSQIPVTDTNQSQDDLPYQPKILTTKGRIGRRRLLAYGIISFLCVIPLVILITFSFMFVDNESASLRTIGVLSMLLSPFCLIAMVIFTFILTKRRLNDLNQPGWLSLLYFVPFANVILALLLVFASGTKGENAYGAPPTRTPIGITILALLTPISIVIFLAVVSISAYQDYVDENINSTQNLIEKENAKK